MENKDEQAEQAPPLPQKRIEALCIYAQPDETFYTNVKRALILGERHGYLAWLDVHPGDNVAEVLQDFFKRADVILLLLSPDFFATDACYTAMKAALQEQSQRQIPVVPVLVRPSSWKISVCKHLKVLPDNEQPVSQWDQPELAYENIRIGLTYWVASLSPVFAVLQHSRPKLFQARDLPRGYVPRPKAFEAIKGRLLTRQDGRTTAISTALRGAGGFGKTTLALALCHDLDIQRAFPDGILWVELGEQPPRILDLLNGLLASLEGPRAGAITLEEARSRWHTALGERICLLVIDDVWHADALIPLLEGGPQCIRLVTTRNDQVLPEDIERIWVDAMEPDEAYMLLCRGLPDKVQETEDLITSQSLIRRLGYWPLLLSLANGMLVAQVRHGRGITQALVLLEQAYDTRGVLAFDPGNLTERQRAVQACIDVSLRHLEDFTSRHFHAVQRYSELAVFPEDIDIPLATLRRFWHRTGGLEPWEVDDLCIHLHDLSLLLACDLGTNTIRLHDVMRNYLIQRAGGQLPLLHTRLLDAYRKSARLTCWAELPLDESYLWRFLVWHLYEAKLWKDVVSVFTDLHYLIRKVYSCGITVLESEIELVASISTSVPSSVRLLKPSFVESLRRMVRRVSHLIPQVTTLSEVGGILLSYLGWEPEFAAQRTVLEQMLPHPLLTPWHRLPGKASSALLRTLRGHTSFISSCAISADGRVIVSASLDRTLKGWNAASGEEQFTLTHTEAVNDCVISANGRIVVSACEDNTLTVWDNFNEEVLLTLHGHTDAVTSCAISADGHVIVSASEDGTLKVWDIYNEEARLTLRGHTDAVTGCAISADGRIIVSVSVDGVLKVWDAASGQEQYTSLQGRGYLGNSCAISADGHVIIFTRGGTLRVWDAVNGKERLILRSHGHSIRACAISADGCVIASASSEGTLKVWNAASGKQLLTFRGHTDVVRSCAISADRRVIVSASDDRTLKVWDAVSKERRLAPQGYTDMVRACAISADGCVAVSASRDGILKVWNAASGKQRFTLSGHTKAATGCAVSADSHVIVSASEDRTLKVWANGEERFTLCGHAGIVNSCAISADGCVIVSASTDGTLRVWNASNGMERLAIRGYSGWARDCAISADGNIIVSASTDGILRVWDTASGQRRLTLWGHTGVVNSCAISADRRVIVSASDDRTLKVWDSSSGVEWLTLSGHTREVNGCAISMDGRVIISASEDGTLKVWNALLGRCMLTFPVDGPLFACAFHPDGEHLVACGAQGMYFLRLVQ